MYLFDTSALIGLTERGNKRSTALIEDSDQLPFCHVVTLGELAAGVQRAEAGPPDDLMFRRTTLTYARRLPLIDAIDDDAVECFGLISMLAGRRLSHNDRWILAATYVRGLIHVTEDALLHNVAADPTLTDALRSRHGINPEPPVRA